MPPFLGDELCGRSRSCRRMGGQRRTKCSVALPLSHESNIGSDLALPFESSSSRPTAVAPSWHSRSRGNYTCSSPKRRAACIYPHAQGQSLAHEVAHPGASKVVFFDEIMASRAHQGAEKNFRCLGTRSQPMLVRVIWRFVSGGIIPRSLSLPVCWILQRKKRILSTVRILVGFPWDQITDLQVLRTRLAQYAPLSDEMMQTLEADRERDQRPPTALQLRVNSLFMRLEQHSSSERLATEK